MFCAQSLQHAHSKLLSECFHAAGGSPYSTCLIGIGTQAARDALAALRCDALRAKSWARAGDAFAALAMRQLAHLSYDQVRVFGGALPCSAVSP